MENTATYNEEKLLRRISDGEEAAFNELFNRYRDQVYAYALQITKSPDIAEDIVVDIFMKFWLGRELFAGVENLEGLLRTVARNKALDFLRTVARQEKLKKAYAGLVSDEPKGPYELLVDQQTRDMLQEAIHQLPPQRRLIFQLSREKGLTHEEIAAVLGLSRNTVKNTMATASRSIAEYLQQKYGPNTALGLIFLLH